MSEIYSGIYSLVLAAIFTAATKILLPARGKALDFLLSLMLVVAVALPLSGTADLLLNLAPGAYSAMTADLSEKYLKTARDSEEKLTAEAVSAFEAEVRGRICRRFDLPEEAVEVSLIVTDGQASELEVALGIRAYLADSDRLADYAADISGLRVKISHR